MKLVQSGIPDLVILKPIRKVTIEGKTHYCTAQTFYSGIGHRDRLALTKTVKKSLYYEHIYPFLKLVPKEAKFPLHISFHFYRPEASTKWDLDNLMYFWIKLIIDCLKSDKHFKGLFPDDSVEFISGYTARGFGNSTEDKIVIKFFNIE